VTWKGALRVSGERFQLLITSVHQLLVDLKSASGSVRREVLYNILIEFWLHMKLVMLIKTNL
jgi:hypothetical protein